MFKVTIPTEECWSTAYCDVHKIRLAVFSFLHLFPLLYHEMTFSKKSLTSAKKDRFQLEIQFEILFVKFVKNCVPELSWVFKARFYVQSPSKSFEGFFKLILLKNISPLQYHASALFHHRDGVSGIHVNLGNWKFKGCEQQSLSLKGFHDHEGLSPVSFREVQVKYHICPSHNLHSSCR